MMKNVYPNGLLQFSIPIFAIILLTSCNGGTPVTLSTPISSPTPTNDTSGLSTEEAATLRSLEKLDNYPFYVMHYSGAYEYPQIGSDWLPESDFTCSLFAALGKGSDMIYGRNFDWSISPALLLYTDPPVGYASVSMVDLEFIGIHPEDSMDLTSLPLTQRTALLGAPSMPFDGMNEYGLTIGMAALPENYEDHAPYNPSKPTIGSIGIIRLALDHARDVREAIALFEQYNIDYRGGPLIHYLLADRSEDAVLIEFYQGEMIKIPNEDPWHMATNHFRCTAQGDGGCPRYGRLSERLSEENGQLDLESAMGLLSEVSQSLTQWSAVYDMTSGDIQVALGGEYDTIYSFQLNMLLP